MKIKLCLIITVVMVFAAFSTVTFAKDISVVVYALKDYPPYSYEENGEVKGIYTEIFKQVFSKMKGYKVEIKSLPWKRGMKYLEQGKAFAFYPPYYRTERTAFIQYSVPILKEEVIVLCSDKVLTDSRPNWPEDYYGLTIGKNSGYSVGGDKFITAVKEGKIKLEEKDGNRPNILKLGAGRIDCYINDRLSVLWKLNKLKESGEYKNDYAELEECAITASENGYLGFTIKDNGKFNYKNDFLSQFNSIVNEMKNAGEIQKIIDGFIH